MVGGVAVQIGAVMDALGEAVSEISGLRVHPYYAERVTPPAAIVGWPEEYAFDTGMQRGSDRLAIPLIVVVGRADARSTRDRLALYADGGGDSSIKAAVERYASPAWDSARVQSVEFGISTISAVAYLSATFNIDIEGTGG